MVPEGKGGPRVAHGGDTRDGMRQMDGLTMGNLSCGYSCTTLNANDAQTEELSYEIGAVSADVAIGGVRVNVIPKEGGNTFSGSAFGNFSNSGLQGDNLSRELLDLGLRTPDVVDSIWDSSLAALSSGTGCGSTGRTATGASSCCRPTPSTTGTRPTTSSSPTSRGPASTSSTTRAPVCG